MTTIVDNAIADQSFTVDAEAVAGGIADALVASAISDGWRATWLAPALGDSAPRHRVPLQTGDPGLYQGSAGIAWACLEAAAALDREALAGIALQGARGAVSRARPEHGTGLYDGLTGIGLTALVVGTRLGDSDLAADGRRLLDSVAVAPADGPELVRGCAGVIVGLLAADRVDGTARWLPAAVRQGDALVAQAERHPWGWAWPLPAMDEPALCGLAHGAAGIAWALGELLAAGVGTLSDAQERSLADGIEGATLFERSWFDYRHNAWPDLRTGLVPEGTPAPRPTLWCHGTVGAGLARLRLNELSPEPALLAEAAAALQASVAAADRELSGGAPPFGLTVCHGLGGTLELLATAADTLGESEHRATAQWLLDRAIAWLGADPEQWPSGVEGCSWAPGLMIGTAGTMLVLLRLARPGAAAPGVGLLLAGSDRP